MEANLAFDINDPEFAEFLPSGMFDQLAYRWTDFNLHDPGVTLLEALRFAFEDLTYRYQLPIADILQGPHENALENWHISMLNTPYAINEHDYRCVLAADDGIVNAVALPAPHVELQGKPPLACLLAIYIAPAQKEVTENTEHTSDEDQSTPNIQQNDEKDVLQSLLHHRALGEYFHRPQGVDHFIVPKINEVDISIHLQFEQYQNTNANRNRIIKALAEHLLPKLVPYDFRKVTDDSMNLAAVLNSPSLDNHEVIDPYSLIQTCWRNKIVVSKLYPIVQQFPFVIGIQSIAVRFHGMDQPYESRVLRFDDFYFTRLADVNFNMGSPSADPVEEKEDEEPEAIAPIHDELWHYPGMDHIEGDYRALDTFNSIQLSFPPNYHLGDFLIQGGQDTTQSFRLFLAIIDQLRANVLAQLGQMPEVFNTNSSKRTVQSKSLTKAPFYDDLHLPEPMPIGECQEPNKTFGEQRLNYLLALNGWMLDQEFPFLGDEKYLLNIKREFLRMVHNPEAFIKNVNHNLNAIFQSISLKLLQEKIRILGGTHVSDVRIIEHCFLQPVVQQEICLNFELTVLLFFNDSGRIGSPYSQGLSELIRDLVPAHIVPHIQCISNTDRRVCSLDENLNRAYPPNKVFYFNSEFTPEQLEAMRIILHDWVMKTPQNPPTINQ